MGAPYTTRHNTTDESTGAIYIFNGNVEKGLEQSQVIYATGERGLSGFGFSVDSSGLNLDNVGLCINCICIKKMYRNRKSVVMYFACASVFFNKSFFK